MANTDEFIIHGSGRKFNRQEVKNMQQIPKDPVMLLSYINTQLRDFYPRMSELCKSLGIEKEKVDEALKSIDYVYDPEKNQYV